jgi:glycosyltransferase involved in cell wall biosynthesis
MKIAFLHYHLKPGGVTTVINQQVQALGSDCETLILTGDQPNSRVCADTVSISGIGYDKKGASLTAPEDTAGLITKAINSKWKEGCDILHVHNPVLAKNQNFLKILKALQKRGINLFLQIHDFAEDGRPLSYYRDDEYLSDCHYGVINSRDYNVLLKAGLKKQGVHKIFNCVDALFPEKEDITPKNIVLYPVRAIRRKNIGEAILLSLFFKHEETLAITRPPNSEVDLKSHRGWKTFAKENNLNIEFDASLKNDYKDLVGSSKFFITTSITEGFGFSFLEPWTAKKFILGRKLPDICIDFEKKSINLDHLYTKMLVPVSWIGKKNLYAKVKSSILKNCDLFRFSMDFKKIERFLFRFTEDKNIDFGLLDEAFQKKVISRVLSGKKNRDQLIDLNPCLMHVENTPDSDDLVQNNAMKTALHYSKSKYRENLLGIYDKVTNTKVTQNIDKRALLMQFFAPENFSLLKWNSYVE